MPSYIKFIVRLASRIFHIFPLKHKKIFLLSFNGTIVGHDAKALVEYAHEKGLPFTFIWGTKDKTTAKTFNSAFGEEIRFCKLNSLRGIYELLTSGVFFYNIQAPSYLAYRHNQIMINTWHGFPYKASPKLRSDEIKQVNLTTCFLSEASICSNRLIKDHFGYTGEILASGMPRTDVFFSDKKHIRKEHILSIYNISDKKIVLYAPTFRGSTEPADLIIDIGRLKSALNKRFGGEWIVMLRLHPMIIHLHQCTLDGVVNVSDYQDTQDLLCTADILITDYSSIAWEFSLMHKPVFIFAYDLDKYKFDRGLFFSIEEWPYPICKNNDDLEDSIRCFNETDYAVKISTHHKKCGCYDTGHGCEAVFNYINDHSLMRNYRLTVKSQVD